MVTNRLYRSRTDRMIAGVCGGLGEYFGIDSTLVRLFFVIATIFTGGLMILVYLIMWALVPEEPFGFPKTGASEEMAGSMGPNPPEPPLTEEPPRASFGGGSFVGSSRFSTPATYDRIHRRRQWIGWALVSLGALALMSNLNLLSWLDLHVTWPIFLILAGMLLLLRQRYQRY